MYEEKSFLKLRDRIFSEFGLNFRYSRKCHCLYGSFAVVPDGLRQYIENCGFSYFRYPDGLTFIELK